ncbi:MAG: DUF308 domain-containing protein [Oscillospiraceae bacterium]|nr:DUF308 domain-containing protein [Oscillospiraceae bacterium]
MKKLKEHSHGLILTLAELLVGILLLIDPEGFTAGIIVVAGVGLLVLGLISAIRYFRADPVAAAAGQFLMKGLLFLLLGVVFITKSGWFIRTFPILTILYAVAILIAGLSKVQMMVDMLRLKRGKWFLAAISAVLSLVCAALILVDPFATVEVLWIFTGISLIVEAVLDLVTTFVGGGKKEASDEAA